MPRSKDKIKRTPVDKEKLLNAIKLVKEGNKKWSFSAAAKECKLSRCTLRRNYTQYMNSVTVFLS